VSEPRDTPETEFSESSVADLVGRARRRLPELKPSGTLSTYVTAEWLLDLERDLATTHPLAYLPPLLLLVARHDVTALHQFDDDVIAVGKRSSQPASRTEFVAKGQGTDQASLRTWLSGVTELSIAAAALEMFGAEVQIDPILPSGRKSDIKVSLRGGSEAWIEISALTTSNEAYEAYDPTAPSRATWGDPYQDARRIYAKVLEKVAGNPDRLVGQMHPNKPNVLCVIDGSLISPNLASMGTTLAIEQLFNLDARFDTSDYSLSTYVARRYPGHADAVLDSLRRLSALAIVRYDGSGAECLPNPYVDDEHFLSDIDLSAIRKMLSTRRLWR
jgi:hypothetical protein